MAQEVFTLIVIKPAVPQLILESSVFDAQPGDVINLVILNLDGSTHKVSIDSGKIKRKDLQALADPLVSGVKSETIPKNKAEVIQFGVKSASQFVSPANPALLPYTRYKYTVELDVSSTNPGIVFDPDFDVTP